MTSCSRKDSNGYVTLPGFLIQLAAVLLILLLSTGAAQSHPPSQTAINTEAILEILADNRLVGNGWFVSANGLAITAAHTLKQATRIEVISKSSGRLGAKLVARDLSHDLALLKVERPAGFFPYLKISQTALEPGQELLTYGSTLYRHDLWLPGQVANSSIGFEWNESNRRYTAVQYLSAMTPKGLSGAPWINQSGEVVGVQSGMINIDGTLAGIAFIAPAAAVEKLYRERSDSKTISLGATVAESWEVTNKGFKTTGNKGLLIARIIQGGTAQQHGLKKYDIITKINTVEVQYRSQFLNLFRAALHQRNVELEIIRQGKTKTVLLGDETLKGNR